MDGRRSGGDGEDACGGDNHDFSKYENGRCAESVRLPVCPRCFPRILAGQMVRQTMFSVTRPSIRLLVAATDPAICPALPCHALPCTDELELFRTLLLIVDSA